MTSSRQPVLLLGGGLTVLGTIRLLRGAGYAPLVLQGDAGVAAHSAWYREAPASKSTAKADEDLPAYLAGLPLSGVPLVPCSDAWMLRVARCADRISHQFPASISSADTLERLIDKWQLARVLQELQLPHPRTIAIEDGRVPDILDATPMERAFIKPRDSAPFFARFGAKGIWVESRADLERELARIAPSGLAVQLQEYVPGPTSNHFYVEGFIDRHGKQLALFVRQRLRMYPPDFGNSTQFVSVAPSVVPDAVDTVSRLLAHMKFRGVFSVELKRDARDGICKLIEINARPWWYVEFAGQCGVNVCELYVRDALGQDSAPVHSYTVGRSCVFPYYDFYACRDLRVKGELSLGGWARSWATATQPVFRWSDPWPAVAESAALIAGRLARMVRPRRTAATASAETGS